MARSSRGFRRGRSGEMMNPKAKSTRTDALLVELASILIDRYVLAGEEGFEPSNAGIKIRCLNQLGDSPTQAMVPIETPALELTLTSHPWSG